MASQKCDNSVEEDLTFNKWTKHAKGGTAVAVTRTRLHLHAGTREANSDGNIFRGMFLRCGSRGGLRGAGRHGLLPLPIMPFVVRWTGQCLHPLETGRRLMTRAGQGANSQCSRRSAGGAGPRQYCKKCGGHLMTNHPPLGLVDVLSATLPTLTYTPGVHVNYAETVLPMKNRIPKFKDFPAESADRRADTRGGRPGPGNSPPIDRGPIASGIPHSRTS